MRRSGLFACGALLLMASACGRALTPPVEACAEILTRRMPAARVVETGADASMHVTLDFEVGEWWKRPERGRLACSFEEQASGGLRLLDATLDGVALSATERTVINADLLLADLRRAGAEPGSRHD